MHRHILLDLGYTHEFRAPPPREAISPAVPTGRPHDLTTRLRCLKALHDLEHDRGVGRCATAFGVEPRRRAH